MSSEHPSIFANTKLGLQLWSGFEELFDAVASGERKILVKSCNGAGKTTAIAAIVNWMLVSHPDSIILTSAASFIQLRRNLWGEIRKQARVSKIYGNLPIREEMIRISDKHFAIGISPAQPENAQGYHSAKMLIAVDEATAIDRDIMTALLGNTTGGDAQVILAYNPTNRTSFPYEAERSGDWKVITLSAFDHPNIVSGQEKIPGAVSRTWLIDRLAGWSYKVEPHSEQSFEFEGEWYRKTGEVSSRMFGEWPEDDNEGFIQPYLLTRSFAVEPKGDIKCMGVDIARGGDDATVLAFFEGNKQLPFRILRSKDIVAIAHSIAKAYDEGFKIITIDDTGVGGGVTDILKSKGISVIPVNFAQQAKNLFKQDDKKLRNARTEMYFVLESELRKDEIILLNDDLLLQELSGLRLDFSESHSVYQFELKTDLARRLGRSPDRADATALARYGLRIGRKDQKKFI